MIQTACRWKFKVKQSDLHLYIDLSIELLCWQMVIKHYNEIIYKKATVGLHQMISEKLKSTYNYTQRKANTLPES